MRPKPKMRTPWKRLYVRLEQEHVRLLKDYEALKETQRADKSARMAAMVERRARWKWWPLWKERP